jgi:hypothetical protein
MGLGVTMMICVGSAGAAGRKTRVTMAIRTRTKLVMALEY